ncbi:hypothetical protein FS749_003853 [Ceratobasidium sp. UAMH 11750]|nr:hypothetical protein FS749_003853 [Ceratobasidium sp. UAMH 11750]
MPLFIARESEAPKEEALVMTPGISTHEFFGNHDKEHPTCCGVGVSEPGVSASFKYPCYEYSIVLEGASVSLLYLVLSQVATGGIVIGNGEVADDSTGETRAIGPGDVIHVEAGTPVTWKAATKMKSKPQPIIVYGGFV